MAANWSYERAFCERIVTRVLLRLSVFPAAERQKIRKKLLRAIQDDTPEIVGEITDNTSLLKSGLVDSVRLLQLAVVVEREVGHAIDLSVVDLERDWDTLDAIVTFIENARSAPAAGARRS